MIPRVVGTETHEKVKDYIVSEFQDLDWAVELDEVRCQQIESLFILISLDLV